MPPTKRAAPVKSAALSSSPMVNAALMAGAVGTGLWMLVARGRVSWPPVELLAAVSTLAGCLALVGPLILARRDRTEGGLGDLVWLTGGILVWVFDLAALTRGEVPSLAWVNPLGAQTMGLTILAVIVSGWKAHGPGQSWSWTNVTGWLLGLFWVGMAVAALVPSRSLGLVAR